jgi:RNA polymerase sigma factor (sigma-70 family)
MAELSLNKIVTQLRRFVLPGGDLTDGQLLAQFIGQRDEAAFTALVQRHGRMVLGVCRRILGDAHDTEDAFQATFLILVHKAASLRAGEQVGNWLYGVAYNTALAARAKRSRRRSTERQVVQMPEPAVEPPDDMGELRSLLDRELSQLSEVYREAIVLCDLEGKTRKEVARQLGIPEGTLSGRLTVARRQLAERLARHGLALSGAAVALALSQNVASACVPGPLVASTVKAGVAVASGVLAAGAVSASVAALTEGVLKTMSMTKVNALAGLVLVAFLGSGVVLVGYAFSAPAATSDQPVAARIQEKEKPNADEVKKEEKKDGPLVKKILVYGSGNVTFKQGDKETLNGAALKAEDVKRGVLQLGGHKDVVVELKDLPVVLLAGSGNFIAKGLRVKRAVLLIVGSGKTIRLSGSADELVITHTSTATFDGRELKGKKATVNVAGTGTVVVNVTDTLKANVSGPGSVRYLGSPKVEKIVVGGGTVGPEKGGDTPAAKPDPRIERIRKLQAELKRLQEELKKLKEE